MPAQTIPPVLTRTTKLVMVAVIAGVFAVALIWSNYREPSEYERIVAAKESARVGAAVPRELPTRKEFVTMVKGKTPSQIISLIGRPDRTDSSSHLWTYTKPMCIDPISMQADTYVVIEFEFGTNVVAGVEL